MSLANDQPLRPAKPTDGELAILTVLWQLGPSTVRQIFDVLSESRDLGYTTVLKMLQIMTDKGLVTRNETERTHVYTERYSESDTQSHLVKDLADRAFGGSALKLVMSALASKRASRKELAEIRRLLDEAGGGK
ncbi:MAG: BlaI/MecI/CopY family transcriptional regulator [Holophagaceae bacterium]|nr:BlaI/MecI/CopY family transcriptional regulator [Holophagaceae bacterium]